MNLIDPEKEKPRRPRLTGKRIAGLSLIAQIVAQKLGARSCTLFGLPKGQRQQIRAAVSEPVVMAWHFLRQNRLLDKANWCAARPAAECRSWFGAYHAAYYSAYYAPRGAAWYAAVSEENEVDDSLDARLERTNTELESRLFELSGIGGGR